MRYLIIFFTVLFLNAKVYVASAANLTYALPEIVKEFHKIYPNINVKLILASSGKLSAQIMHGAPYDVFLSANMKYPEILYKKGFAKNKPVVFAKGEIVLFSVKYKNLSINNLTNFNQIAIANPKTAPYGKAAIEFFKSAKIYSNIKDKLIFAETINAVISYVINSAEVGIIAKSTLFSKNIKQIGKFYYKDIPQKFYSPIKQGIVLLSDNKEAKKFFKFMLSKEAKKILQKYGYKCE